MLFNSLTFLVFYAIVLALHAAMPTWTSKKIVLLAASYVFYAAWNPPYVFILILSTSVDWALARALDRYDDIRARRGFLLLSLVCNLGLLGFFKYANFALANFQHLTNLFGVSFQPPPWNIVLPVGISFYTFASLSYTIDVYRREIRADVGLLDYALFVSFFPHLVAGPIVRASSFLPQLREPRIRSVQTFGWGLTLVILGVFAKSVLADYVFAPVADIVYHDPDSYSSLDIWSGVLAFAGQIYYDFCGYSMCAVGIALSFGFAFPDNFHHPYAAIGFADFWRRWHISLSTWLRDYLYIPLGGNRHGDFATYRNLFLTMLIGGLWHGASWMFVLWGAAHGILLALEKAVKEFWKAPALRPGWLALSTFFVIALLWIPFRAPDMHAVSSMLSGIFRTRSAMHLELWSMMLCLVAIVATLRWQYTLRESSLEASFNSLSAIQRSALLAICFIAIFLVSGGDERAFIYFQF